MTHPLPSKTPFIAIPAKIELAEMERRVIRWWQQNEVFARSLRQTASGPSWVFYEGPMTANGSPGTHHVEARVFKDVFPRFKTMKGYSVPRRAGWDCHGLPVELAVEKELGLSGKPDIEKIGIAEFNARCRESVQRHVGEFEQLTERMGYWIDLSHPYETMSPEYTSTVCGGLYNRFSIVADSPKITVWRPIVPGVAPRCPTTRSPKAMRRSKTLRC